MSIIYWVLLGVVLGFCAALGLVVAIAIHLRRKHEMQKQAEKMRKRAEMLRSSAPDSSALASNAGIRFPDPWQR